LLGEILETTKVALWEKGLVPDTSTKPIGLSNPTGSACYRNSVNQMLAIPYFKNMVLEGCRSPVASALLDLWSSQYDPNTRVVNDEKLLDQLCESGTMGELNEATKYRQQDASQYLEALFAEINYQMEFEETLERDGYELNRINVEETMLHLSKSETIEEAFSNFINTVTDTNVEKNLRMNSAPPEAMVVNVKRKIFTDEGYLYDNSPMKIAADNKVDFSELYSQPPGSVTYELQGFVWFTLGEMDEGGENSGHYIAYVKRGEDWYQCNDDKITKIDLSNPWNVRVFNIRKNQCVLGTFVKTP
jgi:hypothetical protein